MSYEQVADVKERTSEKLRSLYRYHGPHRLRVTHEIGHKLKIGPYFGNSLQGRDQVG